MKQNTFAASIPPNALSRFWSKVEVTGSCWFWTGQIDTNGYGKFAWRDITTRTFRSAHRIAYLVLVGPIPDGLHLDHLCRNRSCVNPDHLEPVTIQENIRRGYVSFRQTAKTHCPQGHPYDEENTYIAPNGSRMCRICRRAVNLVASRTHKYRPLKNLM